jgi:8-oxo-dGTP diphosphatase
MAGRRRYQRIGTYGICIDDEDRVLLVRASKQSNAPGSWFLPGGGLEHGEAPLDGLRREVAEETGLTIDDVSLRGVLSDLWTLPDGAQLHTVRIVYRIGAWHGELPTSPTPSSSSANPSPRRGKDGPGNGPGVRCPEGGVPCGRSSGRTAG